jgi:hypothetical protein
MNWKVHDQLDKTIDGETFFFVLFFFAGFPFLTNDLDSIRGCIRVSIQMEARSIWQALQQNM